MTHGHRHGPHGGPGGHGWQDWLRGAARGRGRGGPGPFDPDFGDALSGIVDEALHGVMRGRRMFDGGELRLVLLKLIEPAPRHGYDLIRQIEEITGGAYAPSPGVVYPTLTLLADMELIVEQQSEGTRKLFAITPAGTTHLAERTAEVDALMARLEGIGDARARSGRGPVRRAMGNIRSAIHERLRSAEGNAELPHDIAAILDEAARQIERL